jgi:hypothetical protein
MRDDSAGYAAITSEKASHPFASASYKAAQILSLRNILDVSKRAGDETRLDAAIPRHYGVHLVYRLPARSEHSQSRVVKQKRSRNKQTVPRNGNTGA